MTSIQGRYDLPNRTTLELEDSSTSNDLLNQVLQMSPHALGGAEMEPTFNTTV